MMRATLSPSYGSALVRHRVIGIRHAIIDAVYAFSPLTPPFFDMPPCRCYAVAIAYADAAATLCLIFIFAFMRYALPLYAASMLAAITMMAAAAMPPMIYCRLLLIRRCCFDAYASVYMPRYANMSMP